MAELLRLSGYSAIGLTVPPGLMRDKVSSLREVFEEQDIETFLRLDIVPRSRQELLRLLRRYRTGFDVLAVKCVNPAVALVACRDRRVDIVFFDPSRRNIRFSYTYSDLLHGALEFNVASDLLGAPSSDVYLRLAKQAAISRNSNTRIVLSSGATTPEGVRSPMQLSALGQAIGLSRSQVLRGVSENPVSIIRRNSERRSGTYIEEGVRVVAPKAR